MTDDTIDSAAPRQRIAFITRAAPYGQNRANLCLDMALACAVFEQDVSYIFMDDGVYQLIKGQDGAAVEAKTLGNALETLALYGIEQVCVDRQSLTERGISVADLLPGLTLITEAQITDLIEDADTVFNL